MKLDKDRYLTARWNNILSLGLGIPALIYTIIALATGISHDLGGFIGMAVFGIFF